MAIVDTSISIPLTISELIDEIERRFDKADLFFGHGTDNPYDEAVYLVFVCLGIPFEDDRIDLDQSITDQAREKIMQLVEKRISLRKPVAYLVNKCWFAGLPFYVDERVLIPRSPFAELIEQGFSPWIRGIQVKSVLDIGTGSGCMAVACARTFTGAVIDAIDTDVAALAVAGINVKSHKLTERINLIESDLFAQLAGKRYDLIIANPPYVDQKDMDSLPLEYRHEPRYALAAGEDGLAVVRRILAEAGQYLNHTGVLVVEVGNSRQAMEQAFPSLPFIWLEFEHGGDGVFLLPADALKN